MGSERTEGEVVERIKADLAETCPPGSKHTYALVAKADIEAALSLLAEKDARIGELEAGLRNIRDNSNGWQRDAAHDLLALDREETGSSGSTRAASPNASGAGTAGASPCQSEAALWQLPELEQDEDGEITVRAFSPDNSRCRSWVLARDGVRHIECTAGEPMPKSTLQPYVYPPFWAAPPAENGASSPSEASASAEAPDEPIPTAGDAQRKSEWTVLPHGVIHTVLLDAINEEIKTQLPDAYHEAEGDVSIVIPTGKTPQTAYAILDTSTMAEEAMKALLTAASLTNGMNQNPTGDGG